MKKIHGILGLIIILLITACGPATPPPNSDPSGDLENALNETAVPNEEITAPTITPPPPPESYPAPPLDPAAPEGYPEAPAPPPPPPPSEYPGAYPGVEGQAWIIRPVGEQCAEADQNSYANLQEAIAALTAAGLTVRESEMADLVVCSACGCPTSAHYRVQVSATDVSAAISLGWEQE